VVYATHRGLLACFTEAFPRLASYGVTSGTPIAIAFAETGCRKLINDEPLNEESQAAMD
jgi:hypothetical protein